MLFRILIDVPSGRKGSRALSIALMTSAWAAAVLSVVRQSDQPTTFSGRPGPVRPISVASATNRLLWYRLPSALVSLAGGTSGSGMPRCGTDSQEQANPPASYAERLPRASAGSARLVNAIPAAAAGDGPARQLGERPDHHVNHHMW